MKNQMSAADAVAAGERLFMAGRDETLTYLPPGERRDYVPDKIGL